MARKKLAEYLSTSTANAPRKAVVYWDAQWQDAIVEYYRNGIKIEGASSHHYDDKEDAHNTARSYVEGKI